MSHNYRSVAFLLGLIVTAPIYGQKKADLSRFVVAGDSLSAGYQNSQLIESGQVHGYANVIATQAGVSLNLPLIPLLPFPPPLQGGYPQITIEQGYAVVTGLTPVGRLSTGQTLDVAVPGFTVDNLVGLRPSCKPDLTNAIAVMASEILNPTYPTCTTDPPTELAGAAALKPTTAILWIGSNDALFSLLFGGDPTKLAEFRSSYHQAATTMAGASGHLVVANVPDVTLTAYLTSVPKLAAILNLSASDLQTLGLHAGDMVTPYAFSLIAAALSSHTLLLDSIPQGPVVIRAATLSDIRADVVAYNAVIAQEAADNHATLVDIYSLINDLADNGVMVGGQKLTTDFMGGLFSLDGVHPTNTGYAIIANEFIKTMNQSLHTGIPPVSIEQVSKTDPLIFPDSHPGKHTGHVDVGMADALRHLHRQ
jgi:lysophospholipase L1-like esterase